MGLDAPLAEKTELVPRPPTPKRQLDLAFDHAWLRGMTLTERRTVIAQLARLLLEARGIVTREVGDDHE